MSEGVKLSTQAKKNQGHRLFSRGGPALLSKAENSGYQRLGGSALPFPKAGYGYTLSCRIKDLKHLLKIPILSWAVAVHTLVPALRRQKGWIPVGLKTAWFAE